MNERKAYAKISHPNGVFYMMTPTIVIGRGPATVDLVLSGDPSVSRRQAQIDFSPDLQMFEISVIGKNGIFVNGTFMRSCDPPVQLRSHSDIVIGREKARLLTFYLPSSKVKDRRAPVANGPAVGPSMLSMVGQLLIMAKKPLNADEIYERLVGTKVRLLETLGSKQAIESSIRAALCGNSHIFVTHSAFDLDAMAAERGEVNARKHTLAGFTVRDEHKLRFLKARVHINGNGIAPDGDVVMTEANGK